VHGYRKHFQPSDTLAQSSASIGIFVICADTEEEAKRLSRSRDLWMLRMSHGETAPVPTIEEAQSYPYTDRELAIVQFNSKRTIAGDPGQVHGAIDELGQRYGVDEFVIVTICHDFEARLRSYELLAREFRLIS
jgi:alkanesulfonate monooxygenase SsuD/methylene tetrahydromethanopterin reductase-like flavin-dependent oxidoreductase (luciferase family)